MTKLEKLINERKLNVYQLSLKADMSRITIFRLCNNKTSLRNISVESAIKICNTLNCKLSDIVEDDDPDLNKLVNKFERLLSKR